MEIMLPESQFKSLLPCKSHAHALSLSLNPILRLFPLMTLIHCINFKDLKMMLELQSNENEEFSI